jgi:hypothetical protein
MDIVDTGPVHSLAPDTVDRRTPCGLVLFETCATEKRSRENGRR